MASNEKTRLIDTCALVNFAAQFGDSDNFWPSIIKEITEGRLKTVRQVWDELKSQFPKVHARVKLYRKEFVISDALLYDAMAVAEVRIIQEQHNLINQLGTGNPADPFVIAGAKVIGASVVTDEKATGKRHKSKIPYVCKARNVDCISGKQYLEELGF